MKNKVIEIGQHMNGQNMDVSHLDGPHWFGNFLMQEKLKDKIMRYPDHRWILTIDNIAMRSD